jgi:preprotein translocase subunit SecD
VQISGSFSENQAKTLATELTYGALPVKLDRLTVQTVSPTLGKASLQAGLISGLAGLALVMLYMIFYYRLLGMVVVSGLAVTAALLWAIIAFMGQGRSTPPSTWPASSASSCRSVSPSTRTSSISND